MLEVYLWFETYGMFVGLAGVVLFYGALWAYRPNRRVSGSVLIAIGALLLLAGAVTPDLLRGSVEIVTRKTAVVVGSVQTFDRGREETLVQLEGYGQTLLVYPDHRPVAAGSSISFDAISIGGEIRRLEP